MLGPLDALPVSPRRVLIASASAARAAELAARVARILMLDHTPGQTAPVGERWVADLPRVYSDATVARADTLVLLDVSRRGRTALRELGERLAASHPRLQVVHLTSRHEVEQFVFGVGTHRADLLG